jgi:hypothetical protein
MGRWLAAPALCAAACLAAPPESLNGDGGSAIQDAGRADGGRVEPVDPGPVTIRSIGPTDSAITEGEATLLADGWRLAVAPAVAAELVPGVMVDIGGDRVAVRAIGSAELLLEEPLPAGGSATFWHAYASLADWKDGRARDLVDEGVSEVAAVAADLSLPQLFLINLFETAPDNRVIIRAADGRGHRGVAGTGVTLTADPNACLRAEIDHVTIEGLELRGCGTAAGHSAVKSLDAKDVLVDRVIIWDYRDGEPVSAASATEGGHLTLRNSIVHGGAVGVITEGDSEVVVESCTFFDLDGSAVAIESGRVRNSILIQTGDTFAAPFQDHNVADFALAGADFATAADLFAAPTASPPDLHLMSGASAALGSGEDLRPDFDRDVDGDPRGSIWDIGADQETPPR